jgi:hypothetical protein
MRVSKQSVALLEPPCKLATFQLSIFPRRLPVVVSRDTSRPQAIHRHLQVKRLDTHRDVDAWLFPVNAPPWHYAELRSSFQQSKHILSIILLWLQKQLVLPKSTWASTVSGAVKERDGAHVSYRSPTK